VTPISNSQSDFALSKTKCAFNDQITEAESMEKIKKKYSKVNIVNGRIT